MRFRKREQFPNSCRNVLRILSVCIAALLAAVFTGEVTTVHATTISQIQQQIKEDQKNLDKINETLSGLSDEQDLIEEMIADLNAEIINMMTSISLKEEEIVAKEAQIANKKMDIQQAELDYEAARQVEEEQYAAMKIQIRYMYENNSISLLARVLSNSSFGAMINRAEYIEKVYQSSNDLLKEYESTKNYVQELWDQLVLDKEALEADKASLEADKAVLQDMKAELDNHLAAKKAESANYEAEIQRYKQQAAAAKAKIQKEQKELKKLQDELKRQEELKKQQNATFTDTGYTGLIDSAPGSDLGKQIAKDTKEKGWAGVVAYDRQPPGSFLIQTAVAVESCGIRSTCRIPAEKPNDKQASGTLRNFAPSGKPAHRRYFLAV
jgi:peptidoglycan hydrolase CwlO-like protein